MERTKGTRRPTAIFHALPIFTPSRAVPDTGFPPTDLHLVDERLRVGDGDAAGVLQLLAELSRRRLAQDLEEAITGPLMKCEQEKW